MRVLASLVPLTLLGLGLLGVSGREDLWRSDLGPAVQQRVTLPVYSGIDYTVERIFDESAWPLVAFAAALALWHVARGIRIVMKALNVIHDAPETRPWPRLLLTDVVLALALTTALTAAFLVIVGLPRLGEGAVSTLLHVVAWVAAAAVFAVAVALLVRYAPAERPEAWWAGAGSLLVVTVWVLASLLFGWWAGSVANYKSAVGVLLGFLVLTTYVLTSTTIFLVGVQVDELARKGGR
jgi:membrane protein